MLVLRFLLPLFSFSASSSSFKSHSSSSSSLSLSIILQLPYLSSAPFPRALRLDPRASQFRYTRSNQSRAAQSAHVFEFELRFEAIEALFRSIAVILGLFRRNSGIAVRVFGFFLSCFACHGGRRRRRYRSEECVVVGSCSAGGNVYGGAGSSGEEAGAAA